MLGARQDSQTTGHIFQSCSFDTDQSFLFISIYLYRTIDLLLKVQLTATLKGIYNVGEYV